MTVLATEGPAARVLSIGRQAFPMATIGVLVGLVTLMSGWPYWRSHPLGAGLTIGCCVALASAGWLLQTASRTWLCGVLLVGSALGWSLNWLASWNSGLLPIIGQFAQAISFLMLGTGVLAYADPRLRGWPERQWVAGAVVVLLGGQVALTLTSQPEWMGYRHGVTWPRPLAGHGVFDRVVAVMMALYLVLALWYCAVLGYRARRLHVRQRAVLLPVFVAVGACGVLSALAEQGSALTGINTASQIYVIQGVIIMAVPAALLWVGLRQRWSELAVAARLVKLSDPPSAERVRDALRTVLDDPTAELYFWLPDQGTYANVRGSPAHLQDSDRWRVPMGRTLLEVDSGLRENRRLVEAALAGAALALEHAQLQVELKARLQHIRATHARIIQADATERSRIERNLHDGAQQRLVALAMKLGALESSTRDEAVRDVIRGCREDVSAALQELRELARGIHPAELSEHGLHPALESAAERLRLRVNLDIPDQRLSPAVESTIYLAVCAALTDAVELANAAGAAIRILRKPDRVVAEVSHPETAAGDAPGDSQLAKVADRIEALGGEIEIETDRGTSVKVTLPCE